MTKVHGKGKGIWLIRLLIAIAILGLTSIVEAKTITAASCTQTDVLAAVKAAISGDTVFIPAGICNWTSGVSWTAPANVTLKGAGSLNTLGGGDSTVIVDNIASTGALFTITTNASGTFRLSGITVRGGNGIVKENGMIGILGSSKNVRIDHNHIDKTTYSVPNSSKLIALGGTIAGVVDNNIFNGGNQQGGWLHIVNGGPTGDAAWAAPTGFGGSDFIFIEDNLYTGGLNPSLSPPVYLGNLTDCHTGGRYIARYNTLIAGAVGQTHPTGHAGHDRGCRAHEIYGNTITSPVKAPSEDPNFAFEYNNSGPALVWGNSFDHVYKTIFYFNVIRKNNSIYPQGATPNGWGYCGTEFNGTGSTWDGNTNETTGYPCLDQPGRGQGDLLSGDFPNEINTRTGTIAWPNQALEPVYEWLNVGSPLPGYGGYVSNYAPSRIAENRDYYLYTATFDGTSGVGAGPRANRSATCTKGVAYWSTDKGGNWNTANESADDGTLDVCTATNTWTNETYTPYPYPHPLTRTPASPSPPTNLRINQ